MSHNPKFEVVQCNSSNHVPIFVATCKIQKDSRSYIIIGEKAKTKKGSKHSSAHKLLESLYKEYLFSEQEEPKIEFEKPLENESEKVILYKWTGTCEICYQKGHKPVNCTAPKRTKVNRINNK